MGKGPVHTRQEPTEGPQELDPITFKDETNNSLHTGLHQHKVSPLPPSLQGLHDSMLVRGTLKVNRGSKNLSQSPGTDLEPYYQDNAGRTTHKKSKKKNYPTPLKSTVQKED